MMEMSYEDTFAIGSVEEAMCRQCEGNGGPCDQCNAHGIILRFREGGASGEDVGLRSAMDRPPWDARLPQRDHRRNGNR
jgi:hypothetical protein